MSAKPARPVERDRIGLDAAGLEDERIGSGRAGESLEVAQHLPGQAATAGPTSTTYMRLISAGRRGGEALDRLVVAPAAHRDRQVAVVAEVERAAGGANSSWSIGRLVRAAVDRGVVRLHLFGRGRSTSAWSVRTCADDDGVGVLHRDRLGDAQQAAYATARSSLALGLLTRGSAPR